MVPGDRKLGGNVRGRYRSEKLSIYVFTASRSKGNFGRVSAKGYGMPMVGG